MDDGDISKEELKDLQIKLKTITKGMTHTSDRRVALQLVAQTVGLAAPAIVAGILTKNAHIGILTGTTILNLVSGGTGGNSDDHK